MIESTSIEDFVWPNRYLLTFLGFWPVEPNVNSKIIFFTYFRMIISIFIVCTLFVPQILMIIIFWGDISILTDVGCTAIEVGQLVFKLLYLLLRYQKFGNIYQTAKKLWPIIDNNEEKESFEKLAWLAQRFTVTFFVIGYSNIIALTAASIIIWIKNFSQANDTLYTRALPFDVWYGIDTECSPNFELLFCCQFVAMIFGAAGVIGFDTTMMTFILHTCSQFRLICTRFCAFGNKIRNKSYRNFDYLHNWIGPKKDFDQCIKHHQYTISIAQEINVLLSPVIFVQVMTGGLQICLSGYALMSGAEVNNRSKISKLIIYLATVFVQLVIWCWPGELLIQESTAVNDAIFYELPWYKFTTNQKRELIFLILRSQKECRMTALGYQVMSLRKLTEVFNTAVSYFALLRSLSEEPMKQA